MKVRWLASIFLGSLAAASALADPSVTFHKDVLPILEKRCFTCHDSGPVSFASFKEAKALAPQIRDAVKLRRMPPWFADPAYGEFANDPRLTDQEIEIIQAWAESGAPEGKAPRRRPAASPSGFSADVVVTMPVPVTIPPGETLEPQYIFLPLPFTYDRWVRGVEILPGDPAVVEHAVLYVRQPRSPWLKQLQRGTPFTPTAPERVEIEQAREATENILGVYTRGAPTVIWPDGMGKRVPMGADLILKVQYSGKKDAAAVDQTRVGLMVTQNEPERRVVTLPIRIAEKSAAGALPSGAILLGLRPYANGSKTAIACDLLDATGAPLPLLKTRSEIPSLAPHYILKAPRPLAPGAVLRWTAEPPGEHIIGYVDFAVPN